MRMNFMLFRPEVKRIIVLASTACIMRDAGDEPLVLNEHDWNTSAIEACEKLGRNATPGHKYRASKTLAEKGEISVCGA